jgi:hypothetical protein
MARISLVLTVIRVQQAGFRPMNDPSGKHSASNPLTPTLTFLDTNPGAAPAPDTTGWTCKDHCPIDTQGISALGDVFKENWCITNCGCKKYMTGSNNDVPVLGCPL